jgi:membrane protein DedA with SNARE-associated domain
MLKVVIEMWSGILKMRYCEFYILHGYAALLKQMRTFSPFI